MREEPSTMRWLRDFDTIETAQRWVDVLFGEGIECTVRQSPNERYAIWVHDDDHLERARTLMSELGNIPGSPRFEELADAGRERRRQTQREQSSRRPRIIDVRERFGGQRPA